MKRTSKSVLVQDAWRRELLLSARRSRGYILDFFYRKNWKTYGMFDSFDEYRSVARSLALDGLS